ncbi:SidA/IucD/PvdA family monooxygenase [Kitasatospora sp. NPDC059599]|uniref:SidA/IucD/PvdA family monooxygenase n=1 Tax=Kitasatospora sp. NPDC059599 TaxID=3346880 RepID=UPI00367E5FB3
MDRSRSTGPYDLLVVGGGPKAASLAAKAHCLNRLEMAEVRIVVVESAEIAASWSGRHGNTTGSEFLGTRPEKDVGFPYRSSRLFEAGGAELDAMMAGTFSWQRFLVSRGEFSRWVDSGGPAPTHRVFAEYLAWVFEQAREGVEVVRGRVSGLHRGPRRWTVDHLDAQGRSRSLEAYGVVLTGPGESRPLPCDEDAADRVIPASVDRSAVRGLLGGGREVLLVGAGESAASFATYLLGPLGDAVSSVTIASPTPPYSRAESYLENGVYSEPEAAGWRELPESLREEFIRRTDRGVLSPGVLAGLAGDPRLGFETGRVEYIGCGGDGRLGVELDGPSGRRRIDCDLVVNCIGSSPLAQLHMLLSPSTARELAADAGVDLGDQRSVMRSVAADLAVEAPGPRLHVPALAGLAQGPGFANLSCLGALSDRILHSYAPGGHRADDHRADGGQRSADGGQGPAAGAGAAGGRSPAGLGALA